ncbi:MAG TPA: type II toxin-antitoxin system CcdA family antitoxin [Pseudonocardia sp.]|nr:type II toxin-antitoxin system CcdA family antitoxin [Pseudonocardia sp.]
MARMNVYLPDDLAERAKAEGLNVSGLTQDVVAAELDRRQLRTWLDALPQRRPTVTHDDVISALDGSRGAS